MLQFDVYAENLSVRQAEIKEVFLHMFPEADANEMENPPRAQEKPFYKDW